ncbi:hypothetical protein EZS27_016095 [termite gut metagenome]|uniref:Uncharacterized protein n=1 Tax=termite gut metagenome TaxID=433724 RepID=A0A5J4RQD5_9ZZZZ
MDFRYIILSVFALLFVSCDKSASISVTNNVGNVSIENVSYGDISIGYKFLLPGETVSEIISDGRDRVKFPMSAQLQFYMVSGENKVFLKSKEVYTLDADQHLKIIIDDNTEVINPMKTSETALKIMYYDK